jgi:hypothetical protein
VADLQAVPVAPRWTSALVTHNLLALGANGMQVVGVLVWGWDMFQILMLYWMETTVIAFWALFRLAVLPANQRGNMTVNGHVQAASNRLLLQLFGPFIGISLAGHLLILWVVFSGSSANDVHGPTSFAAKFIVASGAWGPLLFTWLAGALGFYQCSKRSDFLPAIRGRLWPQRPGASAASSPPADGVTAAIGGPTARIAMMQVAIIIGGFLARSYGTVAPWLILIALKTLTDVQRPDRDAIAANTGAQALRQRST